MNTRISLLRLSTLVLLAMAQACAARAPRNQPPVAIDVPVVMGTAPGAINPLTLEQEETSSTTLEKSPSST
ncbi:MAG: hypothetical protein M9944_14360 [Rhizobiaceae bacterium]|nr:hypothetical protein [Rhizobiaceae bacterium]